MTKANITQYSSTPSSNADINDINIAENCPASGLNNAIRELMAHLKNVDTGSQALTALSVAGSVTATTSLKTPLIEFTDGDNALTIADGGNVTANANLTVSGAFTSQGIDDNADATAITIDSSENVGIGTTSPAFATGTGLQVKGSNFTSVRVTSASSTGLDLSQTNDGTSYLFNRDNGALIFGINDTERMRLSTLNRFLVGTTTDRGKVTILHSSNSTATPTLWCGNDGSSAVWVSFGNTSGGVYGSIARSGSSTAYNTVSDHRLKENVDYTFDATTRLKQLKPCRFNFIADADTTVDGFLAHEVQSVVPEAITGTHNEEDDEGNPVMQGIDQSKLVPLLVKTIQELEARITALENA